MSCGNPHETDCSVVLERVYEYLDGELDEQIVATVRQHLEECAPCLSEYDVDQVVKALVRRTCGGDCAPEELRTKIRMQITTVWMQFG